jgi:hypothetical protein
LPTIADLFSIAADHMKSASPRAPSALADTLLGNEHIATRRDRLPRA